MTQIKEETIKWIKSLRLSQNTIDTQNGYIFGEILSRFGIKGTKSFSNKSDLACVFQNYKSVRDAIQQTFGFEIPLDNLIYKGNQILEILHQNCVKLQQKRRLNNTVGSNNNTKDPFSSIRKQIINQAGNRALHLPKKIQDIQQKLQKYKQVKTQHQLLALEARKQQIQYNQRLIQDHREYQNNKLRNNHQFIKQQDTKIYEGWARTQQIKLSRIDRDLKHQQFMNSKKTNLMKSLRQQDQKDFREGLQVFQSNCLKLGIDLVHDPQKANKKLMSKTFNQIAFLERIKQKSQQEQIARKEKMKRQNNTSIQQQQAQKKAQKIFSEQALVQRYFKATKQQVKQCMSYRKQLYKNEFEFEQRKQKAQKNAKIEYKIVFNQQKQEERQNQMRQKRIQYMQQNLNRKIKKKQKHGLLIQQVLSSILQLTEQCYSQQKNKSTLDIPHKFWLQLTDKFIHNQPYNQKLPASIPKLKRLTISNTQRQIAQVQLQNYLFLKQNWRPISSSSKFQLRNQKVASYLQNIINTVYPESGEIQNPNLPLYMPLKLGLIGNTLSGRKTQAQKLCAKYGLVYIDPVDIVKQALILASPPPIIDDKKASKKEAKKPEEEKPQKLIIKQFGLRIKQKIKTVEQATIQILLQAFIIKLKQVFNNKNQTEILQEFKQAEKKQMQRYNQLLKQIQDASKKQKKDTKKTLQNQQPPRPNKNPYTKGFVFVGYPALKQEAKMLQKIARGYISPDEKLNQEAVRQIQYYSPIIKFQPKKIENTLKSTTLDFLFQLQTSAQNRQLRSQGRKYDPITNITYHMSLNPPPNDVKGLNERLIELPALQKINNNEFKQVEQYYQLSGIQDIKLRSYCKISGNQSIGNITKAIQNKIELLLDYKTKLFKQGKVHKKQDKNNDDGKNTITFSTNNNSATKLLAKFRQLRFTYTQQLQQYLFKFKQCRTIFLEQLDILQKNFLDILLRPDDKIIKILNFQQTYNKLLSQKQGLLQIQQARTHLLQKLDKLYDGLWDNICSKKNQAVNQRTNLIKSNWLQKMCQAISVNLERILQIEFNRVTQTLEFCISIKLLKFNRQILQNFQHLVIDGCNQKGEMPSNLTTKYDQFPRIQRLKLNTYSRISQLQNWVKYKKQKANINQQQENIDQLIKDVLKEQSQKLKFKVDQLCEQSVSRIKQYRCLFNAVLNRTDDWIIFGIKKQNDSAYTSIKQIKKYISEAKKSNFKEVITKQIHEIYSPFQNISLIHLPLPVIDNSKIPLQFIRILVQQIKTISVDNKIGIQLFHQYYQRRIKSKLLCQDLLKINFDYLQQYLVQDSKLDFYELITVFILFPYKMPIQEEIQQYKQILIKHKDINIHSFTEIPSFFDKQDEYQRVKSVKYMLYDIYKNSNNIGIDTELLFETLSQLGRMQVQQFKNIIQDRI